MSTKEVIDPLLENVEMGPETEMTFSTSGQTAKFQFDDYTFELKSLRENPTVSIKNDRLLITGSIIRLRKDDDIIEQTEKTEPVTIEIQAPAGADWAELTEQN